LRPALVQTAKCDYCVVVLFGKRSAVFAALFVYWLVGADVVSAQNKPVRLRNELNQTTPRSASPAAFRKPDPDDKPVSGLFLVQFNAPLQAGWVEELRKHRVSLKAYVPEDAFVARFQQTRLADLRALSFVRWIGEYRPDHKVHASLQRPQGPQRALEVLPVSVLFAADTLVDELGPARALMRGAIVESRSRLGIVFRGRLTPAALDQLAKSPAVLWIEPSPHMKLSDEISSEIVAGVASGPVTQVQQLGYDGRGVTVAVADSGLHVGMTNGMHPDLTGRVAAFFQYGDLTDAADEHGHGTHVTGISPVMAALEKSTRRVISMAWVSPLPPGSWCNGCLTEPATTRRPRRSRP